MPSVDTVVSAVYSRLAGDGTLTGLLGGTKIYDAQAPENTAPPYVVISLQADVPNVVLGDTDAGRQDSYLLLVKAVTDGGSMALAGSIKDRIDQRLDGFTPSVAGRTVIRPMRREGDVRYPEVDNGVRYNHSGGSWRVVAV